MALIDTHAHLTDEAFDDDRLFIIRDLSNFNVKAVINPGCNVKDSKLAVKLAKEFDNFYAQVGIHPEEVSRMGESDLEIIEKLAQNPKVVAIGEIGLDYYWRDDNKDEQKEVFIKQLEMARRLDLPVVVHTRDVGEDAYEILKDFTDLKVQIHCFSEGLDLLDKYMDLGFYISIGGVVTFSNGENEKLAASHVDINRLMLETDSPYLTPEPYRGLRNDPRKIIEVSREIAKLRGMKLKKLQKRTSKNAEEFFGL
ncbi:MAG: TatD family hydrolase [Anaerococcus sp.]|uniref:TatD family hydrolase n=1 Tax=Anaerococcus sp. TaxID=1872515 RepID=UPI00261015BF|nr:TatD family hydrolase [Anaerococcus sp.]MCI5972480.1 TatD family hydrolase [Anaerococcus sp.]MDD6919135.1 TatD family hydrolase [Peptoniphilaceae bacterium]MDY2928606.1 TatD family hydrolase [Anaerococcus sp.]